MLSPDLARQLRRLHVKCRRRVDSALSGQYRSVFRGSGIEFEELREYCPGDDVKAMDWNATARLGRPFVKVHREERDVALWLLVDVSASSAFATARPSKREVAAEVAGLLALSAARNGDRVGAVLFSDRLERRIPPRKGASHAWGVVREVLACQPLGRGTDLALALRHLRAAARRRAVVIVLSDFADEGYERALGAAAARHDLIGVLLCDPHDALLPDGPLVRIRDLETGETLVLDARDGKTAEAWSELALGPARRAAGALRAVGVDALEVSTAASPARELLRLFGARARRRLR